MAVIARVREQVIPRVQTQTTARAAQLPALTGLRFIAAALVLAVHTAVSLLPQGVWSLLALSGEQGVCLFFVLSGFILTHNYSSPARGFLGTRRAFYVARFARIYPVLALSLLASAPLLWQIGQNFYQGARHISPVVATLSTLMLVQSWIPYVGLTWNGPAWTLSVEACFYALFPFVATALCRLSRRGLWVTLGAAALATQAAPVAYMVLRPDQMSYPDFGYWVAALYFNPLVHLPTFVIGAGAARLFQLRAQGPRAPTGMGVASAAVFGAFLVALCLSTRINGVMTHSGLLAPLFAVLVYCLAWGQGPVAWLLSTRPALALGVASYAVYLLQVPVAYWLRPLLPDAAAPLATRQIATLLYVALVIIAALAVYACVETPARRVIRAHLGPR